MSRPGEGQRPLLGRPQLRVRTVLLTSLFVLSLFAGRLVQIQGLEATALASAALQQRTTTQPLPAHRGDIVDRTGVVLATTVERRDVTVNQKQVVDYRREGTSSAQPPDGVRAAARDLAPLLGLDVGTLEQRLTGDRGFAYVAKGVSPEVWRQVAALRINGIGAENSSQRVYPAGAVAASSLGFLADGNTPMAGLEMAYDDVLSGTDGYLTYEQSLDRRRIPVGESVQVEPEPGDDLVLTIDRDLQYKAQQLLAAQVSASQAEWGALIAMRPDGEILALANAPTFDANAPGAAPEPDRGNRALVDMFEPGSTAKVVTAAAALEEGVVTADTPFEVPDSIRRGNNPKPFKDSHSHPVEKMTFAGILAQSSNTGTILVGEQMERETLHGYLKAFGFGSPTGLDFPGQTSGILAEPQDWDGRQQYTVMFGQGVAVNALQAVQVFATIANDGVRPQPRLVSGSVDATGVVAAEPASTGTRVVSPDTAATMAQLLEAAVNEGGTGGNAAVPGYRVAGKTGTAEAVDEVNGGYRGYTGSFIGFLPADDPQVVIGVVIQRPSAGGFYGGTVAAPVFQEMAAFTAQRLRIPPSTGAPSAPALTWE